MIKISGIYSIRNTVSGRTYVGCGVNISQRWHAHRSLLRRGKHHSRAFQRSWTKHGENAFLFEILEMVSDARDLLAREQYWIDVLNAYHPTKGFNATPAAGSPLGYRHSAESRQRMSERQKGKHKSPEGAANIAKAAIIKNQSIEMREKVRQSKLALYQNPIKREQMRQQALNQWIAKRASGQPLGRAHTAETKTKLSAAKKGKMSDAHKAAIAASNRARISRVRADQKLSNRAAAAK